MDDTISRAKVMDAVEDAADTAFVSFGDEEYVSVDELKKQLLALPSAQPEERTNKRTETHTYDCISREKAIEAILSHATKVLENCDDYFFRDIYKMAHRHIAELIEQLPSAQSIDIQEAYYRGKIDGIEECTARLKKMNEEFKNG